ncbi:GNAT family N-acetyltransferase [Cytobacillus purgationiresistens]|uniref:Ribosomal protein S18 acetylase RimI-like enzyme n=1 Tax=Cytobacillus purgationiresistens TaxID=863449 RepID=A0ABU0AM95_9BACI|nr:GNAT family N-acetyltransferase [Cytobacillus purgationiresistens]MDQ0271518.1 ribosomal protein S18 acetylase RimI-like enzyme [Cytobacillus purgationiresistens]
MSETFGAFIDHQLIGAVTLFKESKLKMKHKSSIFAMYVLEEKRGLGAGKKLMLTAIKTARETPEIEQVQLTVMSLNIPALKLYASLGFEPYGKERHALKIDDNYFDEDHMVLFL